MMRYFIGIDDTDNLESRGTGHLAREMGKTLEEHHTARLEEITRHQLLVSPLIPFTSHNSSACLVVDAEPLTYHQLETECRSFLLHHSASGADAGLALCPWEDVAAELMEWGTRAKKEVLEKSAALEMAKRIKIPAAGLTGTGGGVIGALAAIGLRAGGNDGRYLWLPGLRDLAGVYTLTELLELVPFGRVETLRGRTPRFDERIDVGEWVRPVLQGGRSVLLIEEAKDHDQCDWRVIEKSRIKQLSE